MRKIVLALFLSASLAGCATFPLPGKLGEIAEKINVTINNPVGTTDLYRVKNAYALALEFAAEYRRYCWAQPYATLMADPVAKPICERRRAVVRAFKVADDNAYAAIVAAENFIKNNPTISPAGFVGAAMQAVTDFQKAIPQKAG